MGECEDEDAMKIWDALIFDEYIAGAGPFYTSDRFCDALGSWAFALFVRAQRSSGSGALTVQAQHSPDKLHWLDSLDPTSMAPLISNVTVVDGPLGTPNHDGRAAYVRLKISLSGTAATRLMIWATARCQLRLFDCGTPNSSAASKPSCSCS